MNNKSILLAISVLLLTGCTNTPQISPTPGSTVTPEIFVERNYPPPTPPSTIPELIDVLLGDYGDEARIGAAYALGQMGEKATPAIPALTINLFHEGPYEVRLQAAKALGEIGPNAQSSVPMLIAVMFKDFVHVRAEAAEALGKIGDTTAIPALALALDDEENEVSIYAAKSIAILANQNFPDVGATGFTLDEDGVPLIVKAANVWWKQEGQFQDWASQSK
ncbi:MAG: HEAT repeat domain-containing protein [Anaerolineales bacterium]